MAFSIDSLHLRDAAVTAEKFGDNYQSRNDLLLGGRVDLGNIELNKSKINSTEGLNFSKTLRVFGCLTMLLPILAGCMNKDTSKQEANTPPSNVPTIVASAIVASAIPTEKPVISATDIPQEMPSTSSQQESNQSVIPEMIGDVPKGFEVLKIGEIGCIRSLDPMSGWAFNPSTGNWEKVDVLLDNTTVQFWGFLNERFELIFDAKRPNNPEELGFRSWVVVSRLESPNIRVAVLAPWVKKPKGATSSEQIRSCLAATFESVEDLTYPPQAN